MARRDNRIVNLEELLEFTAECNATAIQNFGFTLNAPQVICAACHRVIMGSGVRAGDETYCSPRCAEQAEGGNLLEDRGART
jgi:hypothetical protein